MLKKTCCLLAVVALSGYAFFAAPAFAFGPSYSYNYRIYGGSVSGNGQAGPLRMAGTVPVTRNFRYNRRTQQWGYKTQFQRRYSGGSNYANLNQ
jgi:hypothetical protein